MNTLAVRGRVRATHRRVTPALASLAVAVVTLTGCGDATEGEATEGATTGVTSAASSSATQSGDTSSGAGTAGQTASDPLAPTPSAAFFGGTTAAWTVPGTPMQDTAASLSSSRSMIGMWAEAEGGTLRVFEVTAAESDAIWEGQCATAAWLGERLVCDDEVIDPRTGDATPIPGDTEVTFAGGNAEVLVVRAGEEFVAYDAGMAETWRADVVGDGMLYGYADLPVAMSVDWEALEFYTMDLRTGAITPTMLTVLSTDGYAEVETESSPMIGYDFDGTELWQRESSALECVPPYGERQTMADRFECPQGWEDGNDSTALNGFLLRTGGAPQELTFVSETTFAVDGEEFAVGDRGFVMAWLFGDEEHYLARFDTGFGLYASGSPEPVWALDAADLVVAGTDLLVVFDDAGAVAVHTPAA